MNEEDYKKWVCEKSGLLSYLDLKLIDWIVYELTILIRAMWAINRDDKERPITISIHRNYIRVCKTYGALIIWDKDFYFKDYNNNSEQRALNAALRYIFKEQS